MIRELHQAEQREPNWDERAHQEAEFRAWCRIGDPKAVAHAKLIRQRQREISRIAGAWRRKRRKQRTRKAA